MITIYLKALTGEIEILEFVQEVVAVSFIKLRLKKKGYITRLFRYFNESNEERDEKDEKTYEYDEKEMNDEEVVKDGDILCIFTEREEFLPSENKAFEGKLKERLHDFENFRTKIIDNKAIIAGGSVLSVFGNYKIKDLDIYVNYSQANVLMKDLLVFGFNVISLHNAPAYDESFFRKNNIMARFALVYNKCNFSIASRRNKFLNADIMIIPDHIPLENIVTNFDLTFCQIWWDGNKIQSFDIEDIRSKTGSLNPDYVSSYLNMNNFTINRILKYKNRGFNIKIDISHVSDNIITKTNKSADPETWSVTKIVEYIRDRFYGFNLENFVDIFPTEMTLNGLYEKIDKNIVDEFIILYLFERVYYMPDVYRTYYKNAFSTIITPVWNGERQDVRTSDALRQWIEKKKDMYTLLRNQLKSLQRQYHQWYIEKLRQLY